MGIHRLLRKIERAGMDPKTLKGGKPVAWAAPGLSAGIGTEIGLACHRRFLADQPKAKVGLPEILVGLFPGAGGTTRLARMLGLMAAAPVLLEGKMLAPAAAKAMGVVDETPAPDDLLAAARAWVLAAQPADLVKPWDAKGYKFPGGGPYTPSGFMTFVGANAMVLGKTQGAYPAARAMLSAIYEGALVDFDTALRIEARWFTSVLLEPLLRRDDPLALPQQAGAGEGRRPPHRPRLPRPQARHPRRRHDGRRHRHRRRQAGIEVVLVDRDQATADRGRAHAQA